MDKRKNKIRHQSPPTFTGNKTYKKLPRTRQKIEPRNQIYKKKLPIPNNLPPLQKSHRVIRLKRRINMRKNPPPSILRNAKTNIRNELGILKKIRIKGRTRPDIYPSTTCNQKTSWQILLSHLKNTPFLQLSSLIQFSLKNIFHQIYHQQSTSQAQKPHP